MKSLNQRPAAVTVVPALMMPSTSSTSTLVQGHGQRNQPGGVVLPSPGGVRYHKLYSPSVPSVASRLPDHHHHLIPLSQRNNTQFRVCPPMQSSTTQQSSGDASSSTSNTVLPTPSYTATATTSVSRPTSTNVIGPPVRRPQSDLMIDNDEIIFVREETRRNPIQTGPPLKRDATSPFSDTPPNPPAAKRPNTGS